MNYKCPLVPEWKTTKKNDFRPLGAVFALFLTSRLNSQIYWEQQRRTLKIFQKSILLTKKPNLKVMGCDQKTPVKIDICPFLAVFWPLLWFNKTYICPMCIFWKKCKLAMFSPNFDTLLEPNLTPVDPLGSTPASILEVLYMLFYQCLP